MKNDARTLWFALGAGVALTVLLYVVAARLTPHPGGN